MSDAFLDRTGLVQSDVPGPVAFHWFCLSYTGKEYVLNGSAFVKTETTNVTRKMIEDNKQKAGVNGNAILVSCSYLGFMTEEEFGV